MKNTGTLKVEVRGEREILLTRVFDAPKELVWKAMTQPELVKRWFGPRGHQLVECEIDLRPGGKWRYLILMPNGHTYSLDSMPALDQAGESGVRDAVDRHYLQVFGASIALGALSGLAQFNTRGGLASSDFGDQYRQGLGANLASSAGRVLDRYLNVLPTITVREGHRVHVYFTKDFDLPAYRRDASGGVR